LIKSVRLPSQSVEKILMAGFRNTLLIIAGMNAVLMVPSCFFMKARLPPRTPPPWKSLKRPWQDPRYVCLVIGSCLNMMMYVFPLHITLTYSLLSPYFNVPLYTTSNNTSPTITYYSVAFVQAGSFIGRGASGFMADAFGVWNVFIASGLSLTITLLAFWTGVPLPDAVVVIGIFTYGIASGAWLALVAASCASISPTREFGMRLGMLWSCTALLQTFGPVICGGKAFSFVMDEADR
jgi:MCP family monocarboxylic acid transporter-like MFS transporter 10